MGVAPIGMEAVKRAGFRCFAGPGRCVEAAWTTAG
jgi:hypothetical protein